jgi:hypothetical protein
MVIEGSTSSAAAAAAASRAWLTGGSFAGPPEGRGDETYHPYTHLR